MYLAGASMKKKVGQDMAMRPSDCAKVTQYNFSLDNMPVLGHRPPNKTSHHASLFYKPFGEFIDAQCSVEPTGEVGHQSAEIMVKMSDLYESEGMCTYAFQQWLFGLGLQYNPYMAKDREGSVKMIFHSWFAIVYETIFRSRMRWVEALLEILSFRM